MMKDDWERAIRHGDYYPFEEIDKEIDIKERLLEKIDAELKRRNEIWDGYTPHPSCY